MSPGCVVYAMERDRMTKTISEIAEATGYSRTTIAMAFGGRAALELLLQHMSGQKAVKPGRTILETQLVRLG